MADYQQASKSAKAFIGKEFGEAFPKNSYSYFSYGTFERNSEFQLYEVVYNDGSLIVLIKSSPKESSENKETVAAILDPKMQKNERIVDSTDAYTHRGEKCSFIKDVTKNGNEEVIAVANKKSIPEDLKPFTVIRAWFIDLKKREFRPIPTSDVRCETVGIDGDSQFE